MQALHLLLQLRNLLLEAGRLGLTRLRRLLPIGAIELLQIACNMANSTGLLRPMCVRFASESGLSTAVGECPRRARTGPTALQQIASASMSRTDKIQQRVRGLRLKLVTAEHILVDAEAILHLCGRQLLEFGRSLAQSDPISG
jgi:hypothetical protein